MASDAVDQAAQDQRSRRRIVEGRSPHRRRGRADQQDRGPDQPARAQRHHRGGARRRGRPRLRGGRRPKSRRWPNRPPRPPTRSASRSPASRPRPRIRSAPSRKSRGTIEQAVGNFLDRSRPPWKSRARRRRKSPATCSRRRRAPRRSPRTSPTCSAARARRRRPRRKCSPQRSRCPAKATASRSKSRNSSIVRAAYVTAKPLWQNARPPVLPALGQALSRHCRRPEHRPFLLGRSRLARPHLCCLDPHPCVLAS